MTVIGDYADDLGSVILHLVQHLDNRVTGKKQLGFFDCLVAQLPEVAAAEPMARPPEAAAVKPLPPLEERPVCLEEFH